MSSFKSWLIFSSGNCRAVLKLMTEVCWPRLVERGGELQPPTWMTCLLSKRSIRVFYSQLLTQCCTVKNSSYICLQYTKLMDTLAHKREIISLEARKHNRTQLISHKRSLAGAPVTKIQDKEAVLHLLPSVLTNQPEAYTSLSQLSASPQVSILLMDNSNSDLLFHIICNLENKDQSIKEQTLVIVGNLVYQGYSEDLMGYDLIDLLVPSLFNQRAYTRELVCWVFSNIAAEGEFFSTSLINNSRLMESLIQMLCSDTNKVKLEVLYTLKNITENAETVAIVNYLSQDDLFLSLKAVVRTESEEFKLVAKEMVDMIIALGRQLAGEEANLLEIKMERLGLLGLLEQV